MTIMKGFACVAAVLSLGVAVAHGAGAPLHDGAWPAPTGLQLDYMTEPLGVDRSEVAFTWQQQLPPLRGQQQQQVAARVVVVVADATGQTPAGAVVYDSGRVATGQPEHTCRAAGGGGGMMRLASDSAYTWTVQVWSGQGDTATSAPAPFQSGLLAQSDWGTAQWIRGGTQMRRDFSVAAPLARATVFVAACQYYTLYLDGQVVGDQRLDGPWTNFYTNRSYTTHALDPALLLPGNHTLGLRVGQGFCTAAAHDAWDPDAERSAILQLRMHRAHLPAGAVDIVGTDALWHVSGGPIIQDSTYYGEVYDARREQPGWSAPGFTPAPGHGWVPAQTSIIPKVVAHLSSQAMPPIKRVHEIRALGMTKVHVNASAPNCRTAPEGVMLSVGCGGGSSAASSATITAITGAVFGVVEDRCALNGTVRASPACHTAANFTAFVASKCIGQPACTVRCTGQGAPPALGSCVVARPDGTSAQFDYGVDPCLGTPKMLGVSATCSAPVPTPRGSTKFVWDFGQEFAGVARIQLPLHTPPGTNITLKYAEALAHAPLAEADGSVYMGNLFWAHPVDTYIAKGSSELPEVYEPSFTYHGFRYLEMVVTDSEGQPASLPEDPTVDSAVGINLRSSVSEAATLRFGADPHSPSNLVQKLSNNSWWTEAAALMSIPAGAAGRGERNGWTGDASFGSESESFDFDTGAFFSRYMEQLIDQQSPNGEIGGGCPNQGTAPTALHPLIPHPFDPSWSSVVPVVAYNLWKYSNCTLCIDRAWAGLELYMQMLAANYQVTPWTFGRWGDWNPAYPPPGRTPNGVGPPFTLTVSHITAATMVVQNHMEMAEVARATGRAADAARWGALVPTLKQQYHAAFYDPSAQVYGDGTPTAFGCALWLEVTPPALLPAVVSNFVARLASVGYRMDTIGFVGVRYIFEALAKVNRTDVALKMLSVTDYPSFGYQITNTLEPATSLWESYDEPTMRQWLDESSRDHHYSASINTYLRKVLAGLDQPAGANAWKVVKCRPEAAHWPQLLSTASASLESRRGAVVCAWSSAVVPEMRAAGAAPPTPGSPEPPAPTVLCAMNPMFTGAIRHASPLVLQCPVGQAVKSLVYAKWGRSTNFSSGGWYCYGPQPPPAGACEADVAAKLAHMCVGKPGCDLSASASVAVLGDPCAPPPPPGPPPGPPAKPLSCPSGQHVDWVDAPGDNGSCDCNEFCAADWDQTIKAARPHWTGAAALVNGSATGCRCVQGTHWCSKGKKGCGQACSSSGGTPYPANYCTPGPPPPPVPPPSPDPSLTLMVRVACGSAGNADGAGSSGGVPTGANRSRGNQRGGSSTGVPKDAPNSGAQSLRAAVNATVPAGSMGQIHVPVAGGACSTGQIWESGLPVWRDGKFLVPARPGNEQDPSGRAGTPGNVGGSKGGASGAADVFAGGCDGRFVWFETGAGAFHFKVEG